MLLIPRYDIAANDDEVTSAEPWIYVIDDQGKMQRINPGLLHWDADLRRLHLSASSAALRNGDWGTPISKTDLRALKRGEAPCSLALRRRAVWENHVHRLRIDASSGRHPRVVQHSHRFFIDATNQIVFPLLNSMQVTERATIGKFLAALSARQAPRLQRFSKVERQRNRRQAVESYPFLAGLWSTNDQLPLAVDLISALNRRDQAALKRAIDDGQSLSALLPRTLNVEPWIIGHLRRHWPMCREFFKSYDPVWDLDLAATLSVWTPETAPKTLDELHRSAYLTIGLQGCGVPLYGPWAVPISSESRRVLYRLVQSELYYERMRTYLQFICDLNRWTTNQLDHEHCVETQVLGTRTVEDWWMMARRWHNINTRLRRLAGHPGGADGAVIPIEWPPLLVRNETIRGYTFTSLRTCAELITESDTMKHCALRYVVRCAIGESHMIHVAQDQIPIATLEVRKGMYGENIKILLEHAEGANRAPLNLDTEAAIMEFLEACNDGRLTLSPQALSPRSMHADLLKPMMQHALDYPTWERAKLGSQYFDLHAQVSGAHVIEQYRTALEVIPDSRDSLYRLALLAIQKYPTRYTSSDNRVEVVAFAS